MPTPDRRPRGHNRRAQQRRQDESQGTLLQRINAATLPLRQRLGQGMSGLGQRNKEPKAASFKLASPLPRKHTIGLLVLIPLWLLVLAWEPAPAAPTTAPSGSLAVPLAVPAQALTVGNAGELQAAKPVEEKVDGTWLQHDVQAGETLYSIFRKFELPGAELSRLIAIEGPDRPLTRLQSGKSVFILVDTSRRIQRVEVRSLGQVSYRYDRQGEGFALKE
ncbi:MULTISPECIES: LysM-like peptidoglycan-binding domain-containing protein [Aeromonas]|uniref:LysM-like peptidoglycan-binding domain-containing protein n=2 Tax=Aeromonas caviae TaxID=648 RepID=A0AA37CYJ9_AERCA|nr:MULTISPECIES: LysM-like peptidoglycan-binding domain-containing protein [Aeromonas]MBL0531200.1 opacity-associated protein A [Aeromonas caviae]MCY9810584.1 opacity-associated protein A [Aeromonas caviae]MDH1221846.1 opacity-associated protein A [Aeromonas caviae]MDX7707817.1 LysM-like peptidoglycan-binding domain-containing protein [Aeromonas caviae]MDX7723155.1 LysM-like peptidoglycan-binding domain-containing protein [Aeromonas caviae]